MSEQEKSASVEQFLAIKSVRELTVFLGVSYEDFTFLLYRKPAASRYKSFIISKKNGQPRLIEAPIKPIRAMQRKLADVLSEIYRPRKAVYGFVRQGSIKRNAENHCNRPWVLNFDLKDFFHSVHFGRVLAIFQGWRFKFPREVAVAIAHLCCHERRLPQGAPTSPVISNIACDRFDAEMVSFARAHGCRYTRYSDDITISTTRRDLPAVVVALAQKERPIISDLVATIVERNRFLINRDKTKVHHRKKRQEITGLTVNIKPNITRTFVRQVRAMLHAWQRYGLENAQEEFWKKWDKKDRGPRQNPPAFEKVVRGKIDFIGAVRGARGPLHVKLLRMYCHLDPSSTSKVLAMIDAEERDVFLCHASEDKDTVVNPLADALTTAGISYFLDSKEILWGDSVTNVINRALVQARFVLVVISERSLAKHWPQKEMNAALAREISEGKTRVLPLIVGRDGEERKRLWQLLALQGDKKYLEWGDDPNPIVAELRRLLERQATI
jgi:retron-type reverse transcriptase